MTIELEFSVFRFAKFKKMRGVIETHLKCSITTGCTFVVVRYYVAKSSHNLLTKTFFVTTRAYLCVNIQIKMCKCKGCKVLEATLRNILISEKREKFWFQNTISFVLQTKTDCINILCLLSFVTIAVTEVISDGIFRAIYQCILLPAGWKL